MAAEAGASAADRPKSFAVRLWWVFPLGVAIAVAVAALLHREQPLTLARVDPLVLAAARQAAPASAPPAGQQAVLRMRRNQREGLSWPMNSIEKVTLQRLGDGLVLRSDDTYELLDNAQGQRAVLEQRSISWRGLLSLYRAERTPAAVYHDIFADEGWIETSTDSLRLRADRDFPQREGSSMSASFTRTAGDLPTVPPRRQRFEHSLECRSQGTLESASVWPGQRGRLPHVVCEGVKHQLDVDAARRQASRIASRSEYVYLSEIDHFASIAWSVDEPAHPYDADDAPRRRNGHTQQLLGLTPSRDGAQPGPR